MFGYHTPRKRSLILLFVGLLVSVSAVGAQQWVDSFGTDTRYRPPVYISGYGTSDLASSRDRLEAARSDALSQLSRKVRVQVTSEESIRTSDYGNGQRSRYVNNVQTASQLEITGAEFEVVERRDRTHVLAWIRIDDLREQFVNDRDGAVERVRATTRRFDENIESGNLAEAERQLVQLDTAFSELTDAVSLVRALDVIAGRPATLRDMAFGALDGTDGVGEPAEASRVDPIALQAEIEARRAEFEAFAPATSRQAAEYLARLIAPEIGTAERVTPLLYEDADFSSSFGSRMASSLEAAISQQRPGGDTAVVVRGSYWPEEERVAIHVVARDIQTGRTVAAAQTTIPRSAVADADLEPANMDQALAAGTGLLNDQIVDGGLAMEVWTDKGRDERALVFEEGQYVQFYFRVNQPAFLRLSYVLASGDTVLLEDRFYIGIDRVNRVVALPYRFRVVPPFGVERLIVTGHSTEPPPAEVYPQVIDGQEYEVFGSPEEAVVRTRGLVRETPPEDAGDTRVAEMSLSMTTVAAE